MKAVLTASALLFALTGHAAAQFSGDFSGDNLAPTFLGTFDDTFTIEDATVSNAGGTVFDPPVPVDVDVFSFTIAEGFAITSITLTEFVSADNVGFIAIAEGDTFPFNSAELSGGPNTDEFLASDLFGTSGTDGSAPIVADLLNEFVNNSAGGSGLTDPVPAGTFTVFVQQLGPAPIDFGLSFGVSAVPEPTTGLLFATGLVGIVARRRR